MFYTVNAFGPAIAPAYNAWSPVYKDSGIALTNSNLTATSDAGVSDERVIAVFGKWDDNIWQWEITLTNVVPGGSGAVWLGVAYLNYANGWGVQGSGIKFQPGSSTPWGETYTWVEGDIVGVVVRPADNSLKFYQNGSLLNPGIGEGNMMGGYGPFTETVYPLFRVNPAVVRGVTANFGQTPFAYPVVGAYPMHGPTT